LISLIIKSTCIQKKIEMKSQAISLSVVTFFIGLIGCKTGADCLEELNKTHQAMMVAFEEADSSAFVGQISSAIRSARCVEEANDLLEAEKNEGQRIMENLNEMTTGLPCRCYNERLKGVYETLSLGEEMALESWRSAYTEWNAVVKTTGSSDLKYYLKSCKAADASSIASMRSQVEIWNGYHEAGSIIDDVEEALNGLISTGQGVINRLIEKIDEVDDDQ